MGSNISSNGFFLVQNISFAQAQKNSTGIMKPQVFAWDLIADGVLAFVEF